MKAIHFIESLLLQKPSQKLKVKDRLKALERKLKQKTEKWGKSDISKLFKESNTMQGRLPSIPSTNTSMHTENLLFKSKQLM